MPLVHVHMLTGRSPQDKQRLIDEMTRVMVQAAGAQRDRVTVIISEHPPDSWGTAGQPLAAETTDEPELP